MKLLPSLRQKKRYLVFEILSEKKFSALEVEQAITQALKDFLGQLGLAQSAPLFIKEKFNQNKQRFILKINHNYTNEAKTALTLIKKIKNQSLILKSLAVSGTIKKANEVLSK